MAKDRPRESNSPVTIQRGIEVLMPDWSKDLPQDLIISIAKLVAVSSFEDFSDFGAVCKSWKSAADHLKKNYLTNTTEGLGFFTNQAPLLVLPPTNRWNEDDDGMVKFFSLTKGKTYKHSLPETARKVCCSSLGWLLTLCDEKGEKAGLQCHLVHPLNRTNIQLPNLRYPYTNFISKFVISSSPSWALDYVVMYATSMNLQFCRPGLGIDWTKINPSSTPQLVERFCISDLLFYKGQFYVVDFKGCVLVCDIQNPMQTQTRMVSAGIPKELLGRTRNNDKTYLVESAGVLLVVVCSTNDEWTMSYRVFEVPFSNDKSWSESEVKNLGRRTVFLGGRSSSFSIDSSGYSRCKPNCIYFSSSRDCNCSPMDAGIGGWNYQSSLDQILLY
ncbi:hypothetical protein ACLB2K_010679 [Fragaria x ananassa]